MLSAAQVVVSAGSCGMEMLLAVRASKSARGLLRSGSAVGAPSVVAAEKMGSLSMVGLL